jgi:hypothetical protein
MAENENRFVKTYTEGVFSGNGFEIWVDKETGVNYLYRCSGNGGGLTVLLDAYGNPVVTPIVK